MRWPSTASPPPRQQAPTILVFEPDENGHAREWLEHLLAFSLAHGDGSGICLVASRRLCQSLRRMLPGTAPGRIRFLPLSALEHRLCTVNRPVLSGFARWWTMRRYLKRSGARHGVFMGLDHASLPLALGFGNAGRQVSGILFRPSVHYGDIGPYQPNAGEARRDRLKSFLYRRMLLNRAVERVWSLDPFFVQYARSKYPLGEKVSALPDPAHPPVRGAPAHPTEDPPAGRVRFLLFGYLAERKGPLAVMEALLLLPPALAARIAVHFAGRIEPAIRQRLDQQQEELARRQPGLWLRIDDRRLQDDELTTLVQRTDVVLAPYQRFVGSSGVLLWAARNGRPVLAQDFGLIGRLTRDHRLGLSVDSSDPASLADAIRRMVEQGPANLFDRTHAARFAARQTPERFASLVLSA